MSSLFLGKIREKENFKKLHEKLRELFYEKTLKITISSKYFIFF